MLALGAHVLAPLVHHLDDARADDRARHREEPVDVGRTDGSDRRLAQLLAARKVVQAQVDALLGLRHEVEVLVTTLLHPLLCHANGLIHGLLQLARVMEQ
jgi:hypothetical protein